MADFVQTMKDWKRMCKAYVNNCDKCPLSSYECCHTPKNRRYFTDKEVKGIVMAWAAEHPEPVYPNWSQWLVNIGVIPKEIDNSQYRAIIELGLIKPIPADIAEKLGLQPKEGAD